MADVRCSKDVHYGPPTPQVWNLRVPGLCGYETIPMAHQQLSRPRQECRGPARARFSPCSLAWDGLQETALAAPSCEHGYRSAAWAGTLCQNGP